MRVLFICPKQFGYLLDSFYYCRKAPDDVRIDYLCADDGLEKIALPNTNVEYIPPGHGFQAKRRQLFLLLLKAAHAIITRRYEVVFIHCLPYFQSCFLLGLLFPFRKPVCDFRTGAVTMDETRRRKINRRLRWVAKCFSRVSVISESLKRELRLPDRKTFILPLGADIYDYPERDMARLDLLYVGILDSRRIEDTLNGLILFRRKHPEADFRYEIVGGGSPETRARLEALIREPELRDRAALRGYIHHKDIAAYWAKANVGVSYIPIIPCYASQPPTKTFEYLGIGIPVIATDTPENRNIVTPENGVLIGDTAEEFCRGVEQIWNRRKEFRQEKIKRSVGRYTWDEICGMFWRRFREGA